jgi:hypothetical protein
VATKVVKKAPGPAAGSFFVELSPGARNRGVGHFSGLSLLTMKNSMHSLSQSGNGLLVKPLPPSWGLYVGRARCCAAVGFFLNGKLRLTSYIVLN